MVWFKLNLIIIQNCAHKSTFFKTNLKTNKCVCGCSMFIEISVYNAKKTDLRFKRIPQLRTLIFNLNFVNNKIHKLLL